MHKFHKESRVRSFIFTLGINQYYWHWTVGKARRHLPQLLNDNLHFGFIFLPYGQSKFHTFLTIFENGHHAGMLTYEIFFFFFFLCKWILKPNSKLGAFVGQSPVKCVSNGLTLSYLWIIQLKELLFLLHTYLFLLPIHSGLGQNRAHSLCGYINRRYGKSIPQCVVC